MFERNCPVCGSKEKHYVGEFNLLNFDGEKGLFDHQVMSGCNICGAVFHEGIDLSQLDAYYGCFTCGGQIQKMTADEQVLNNNMADFVEYHIKTPKEARILDAGCGYGWVMGILKDRGYTNVDGIDTDKPLMEKLRESGLSVECKSVCSAEAPDFGGGDGQFDVILMKMILEHLEEPASAVDNVRKWLKEKGLLVIEVPDCSLYDETAYFPGYFQNVNMDHINNYSAVSLMNLMRDWRMVACESTDTSGIYPVLRMAFRYAPGSSRIPAFDSNDEKRILASMQKPSEKGKLLLEKIELLKGEKCVVWGVSTFTRALLANTLLKDMDIVAFVDRSPDLQKKTLLGKAIIAPENLKGFDGVIVIPGKTSKNAILRNIEEFGYKNKVVCLSD